MISFEMTRALVRSILEEALSRAMPGTHDAGDWTIQGFGMLRRHLPGDWRLNVWNSKYRVKDVSLVHDHPWHFESLVVSGRLVNRRFVTAHAASGSTGELMEWAKLKPGPGGGIIGTGDRGARRLGDVGAGRDMGEGGVVKLCAREPEAYRRGDVYRQARDEVHRSDPEDGCVTFNRRYERLEVDEARVFWPVGSSWVSAEPRQATAAEVRDVVGSALEGWDR